VRDRYYDRKIKKFQLSVWRVRDRYYDQKKKVLVLCLAGARLILQLENKKVPVVCLAGAQSLLRPENTKVPVVCLAGARLLLRPENKKRHFRQGRCGGHGFRINRHAQGGHAREGKDWQRCDEVRGGCRRRACNRKFDIFFISESFLLFILFPLFCVLFLRS
jgi:hypothetical protein